MNTKGIKFLAVLAVLAMAFAVFAVVTDANQNEADAVAMDVADEDALKAAIATAVADADNDYQLTITKGFATTADIVVVENVNLVIPAGQTLTVAAGKTLTNEGIITITGGGKLVVSGTVANNGAVNVTGAAVKGALTLDNAAAKFTGKTGDDAGAISMDGYEYSGSLIPIYVDAGTLENQIITLGNVDADCYGIQLNNGTGASVLQNNTIIGEGSRYVDVSGANDTGNEILNKVIGNVFLQEDGAAKSVVVVGGGAGVDWPAKTIVQITGNDFSDVKAFDESVDYKAVRVVTDNIKIGSSYNSSLGVQLIVDDTASLGIKSGGGVSFVQDVTVSEFGLADGATTIASGVTLTATDVMTIGATLTNNGTIVAKDSVVVRNVDYKEGTGIDAGDLVNNGTFTLTNAKGVLFVGEGATVTNVEDKEKAINGKINFDGYFANEGTFDNQSVIECQTVVQATYFEGLGDGTVNVADIGDVEEKATAADVTSTDFTDAGKVIISTTAVETAVIPAERSLIITDVSKLKSVANNVLDVTSDDSSVAVITGDSTATFSVQISSTSKVQFTDVTGTLTFSKGSIVVDTKEWVAGTITLNNGDDLKISGDGAPGKGVTLKILVAGTGTPKATLNVLEGTELMLNGEGTLEIAAGITVNVDGKITGEGNLNVKGTMNINDGGVVDIDNLTVKTLNVNSGAVLEGDITNTDNVTVYSGSDINGIVGFSDWSKVTGKDSATGTWKYIAADNKLVLEDYNGTYNFGAIYDVIEWIAANGENSLSYAIEEDSLIVVPGVPVALFKGVQKIDSDKGSLTIDLDASELSAYELSAGEFYVFFTEDADLDINQIGLFINVFGANSEWTEDVLEVADVAGIYLYTEDDDLDLEISIYNSTISVDVLSSLSYDAPVVGGIGIGDELDLPIGTISMISSELAVKAKGYGVAADIISIMSSTGPVTIDADKAVVADVVTVQKTLMSIKGDVAAEFGISNQSVVGIDGVLETDAVYIDKESALALKDLILSDEGTGITVDKAAAITVSGTSVIAGELDNSGTFINEGNMYVYGNITNTNGSFTNTGKVFIQKYVYDELKAANNVLTVEDGGDVSKSKVKILSITIDDYELNPDGTAEIEATVEYAPLNNTGDAPTDLTKYEIPTASKKFTGTLSPSQTNGTYTMVLRNGNATVNVAYNGEKTTVSGTGSITVMEKADASKTKLFDIQALATNYDVDDKVKNLLIASEADMFVNGGAFVNNSEVSVYSGAYAAATPFLAKDATYTGNLAVGTEAMYIAGTMTGSIISAGAVEIKGTLDGNLTAKTATVSGTVKNGTIFVEEGVDASAGKITDGKIIAKEDVDVKEMTGDIEINGKTADVNVTFKKLTGNIIFNSTYNTDEPEPPATPTTETVTSTMAIDADSQGTTIILKGATNKAGSTAGAPGFFVLKKDSADASTDKTVDIKLTAGVLKVMDTTTLMKGYVLTIEADTTLEVSDKNASLIASGAALKVSKDAIAHYEEGSASPVNYGKVAYIMKFDVSAGYTIYSNIAYALSNSDAGSILTMGQSDTVDSNVIIGEGIKVIVPKDVVLTFDGHDLDMADTAMIIIEDNGQVKFQQSRDNTADLEEGDLIDYYTVSGTIIFDEDNGIVFDEVRFTNEAESVVKGVAATSTEDSKISATLYYEAGKATLASGYGTGVVKISNARYAADVGDEEKDYVPVSAAFAVDVGAVFDTASLTDASGFVTYKTDDKTVDTTDFIPTNVNINGTLILKENTVAKGIWAGLGTIALADKKTFTVNNGEIPKHDEGSQAISANISIGALVDTTDELNGYSLLLVSPLVDKEVDVTVPLVFTAKEYKIEGTNTKVMSMSGGLGVGMVSARTCAVLDQMLIFFDTDVIADTTYVVGDAASVAAGNLATKNLYMKEEGVTGYADFGYMVTYEAEGYTVYTFFQNVDLDEVSDIELSGTLEDEYDLSDLVSTPGAVATKADFTGKDVNITVAEGKTLVIDIPLIIGTPIDSIGADGSSITGKVVIAASADNPEATKAPLYRYIVAYADVDLLDADIYQADGKTDAVYSVLLIDDLLYATIFANEGTYTPQAGTNTTQYGAGMGLALADKTLIPDIEGYVFTKWSNLNEDPTAAVGETSAFANAKAMLVSVVVKFAEGVSYYLDGVEFAIYDTPTKVEYNSVFTAKINNTAKYEGTPLINGKNSFIVTEDATLTVTGVNPIPVPPEPTPEPVEENTGLSLTDILLIVLVILIAIMVVILVLRLNRS